MSEIANTRIATADILILLLVIRERLSVRIFDPIYSKVPISLICLRLGGVVGAIAAILLGLIVIAYRRFIRRRLLSTSTQQPPVDPEVPPDDKDRNELPEDHGPPQPGRVPDSTSSRATSRVASSRSSSFNA